MLLASQRALPARATERGFEHRYPILEPALRDAAGVAPAEPPEPAARQPAEESR
jgi:hypothetical protein